MKRLNVGDITIKTLKGAGYHCSIYDVSKSEAMNLFENSVLNDRGFILNTFQINQH